MIQLEINNNLYDGFYDFKAKRSMLTACSQFVISASTKTQAFSDFPIKQGDKCRIIVDGKTWITGFIEKLVVSYNKDALTVQLSGRDITSDIIDSTVIPEVSINGPISLENLIKTALSQIGININVINKVPDLPNFSASEIVAPDIGTGFYQFLEEYCRQRAVLLLTDNNGNLVITRSSNEKSQIELINKVGKQNNIVEASATFDSTSRYNRYYVLSQINMATLSYDGEDVENSTNRYGEAFDDAIRSTRVKCLIAENPSTIPECKNRAIWEANVSRSRSISYSCLINSHSFNGEPFDYNKLVLVDDDYAGINSLMLIETVELSASETGNTASLTLVTPDAYNLQATAPLKQKNSSNIGLIWNESNFQ